MQSASTVIFPTATLDKNAFLKVNTYEYMQKLINNKQMLFAARARAQVCVCVCVWINKLERIARVTDRRCENP